jgi:hypothetical protein
MTLAFPFFSPTGYTRAIMAGIGHSCSPRLFAYSICMSLDHFFAISLAPNSTSYCVLSLAAELQTSKNTTHPSRFTIYKLASLLSNLERWQL